MKIVLTGLKQLEIQDDSDKDRSPGSRQPAKGFVKTDVLCCAVCRTDAKMWEQGHRDLALPRVLGHEMVVMDREQQRYVVWPGKSCRSCQYCRADRENLCEEMKITGFHTDGGFADAALLPEESLIPIPDNLDIHAACFAEPVGCVINAFEKHLLQENGRVLIYGAGTMGLITAYYVKTVGMIPLLIEKNEAKISHITPVLDAVGIPCVKETHESEFDMVINTCADFIAFCQGIVKAGKGGKVSFFSGINKNEQIETNLLNLIHYKELEMSGVYGMTKAHMEKGIRFIQDHQPFIKKLIEQVIAPENVLDLMPKVLAGTDLKYILDMKQPERPVPSAVFTQKERQDHHQPLFDSDTLFQSVMETITPLPDTLTSQARSKIDNKTKPLGALGRLEALAIQMCRIQGTLNPEITRKQLFVFAGDHGICEEGVSAYPSDVTAQMVDNFLNGGAAINVLCRHHHIDMKVVDMGVKKSFLSQPDLVIKKVAQGTANFAITAAMTVEQMAQAIENGMAVFLDACKTHPVDIVGLGEMGIGNTSSASAIISAVTGIFPAQAVGRGTGVDDKGLSHKTEVIEKALHFHNIHPENGFDVLQKVGGFEIAGIVGAVLAAASKKTAVVLDGVISTAAGLIACLINPDVGQYLISGHKSVEKAQAAALSHMNLVPVIDLDMRLGEGTGAALAMDMADAACKIMTQMASFDDAKVERSFIK